MTLKIMIKHMRTYGVLGTAMLLSSCLFVSSSWAAARDVLSFVSLKDKTRPIILMDTQGNILQKLVIPGTKRLSFSWSPDGRSFAYHTNEGGNFDIYVMDVETQTSRQLTFDGGMDIWPSWSPNGKWISFASNQTKKSNLYRIDVDGGNLMKLTDGKDCDRSAWSPDSQWIAFTSRASLFVMNAKGKNLRKLTGNAPLPACTWSPDSKQIAFVSNTDIFSIDINGKNLRQLTQFNRETFIWDLAWSPSGEWIAYSLREALRVGFDASVLCLVNTVDDERGGPLKATKGLEPSRLGWVPGIELSISPSPEKQTTPKNRLKQTSK